MRRAAFARLHIAYGNRNIRQRCIDLLPRVIDEQDAAQAWRGLRSPGE